MGLKCFELNQNLNSFFLCIYYPNHHHHHSAAEQVITTFFQEEQSANWTMVHFENLCYALLIFVSIPQNYSSTQPDSHYIRYMGPLLFILYVNDITFTSNVLDFILFADDTTILYSHKDINSQVNSIQFNSIYFIFHH